jgi:hypothetical protein
MYADSYSLLLSMGKPRVRERLGRGHVGEAFIIAVYREAV